MDIFMHNIKYAVDSNQVINAISEIVHGPLFSDFNSQLPLNFKVHLHQQRHSARSFSGGHKGTGILTLPTRTIGQMFLGECGGQHPKTRVVLGFRRVSFEESKKPPRQEIVESINHTPFVDPRVLQEKESVLKELNSTQIPLSTLQLCWECRDSVLSAEWQRSFASHSSCFLKFNGERREMRITIPESMSAHKSQSIVVHLSQIMDAFMTQVSEAAIVFLLAVPPTYDAEPKITSREGQRQRLICLIGDEHHKRIAPYSGLVLRVILSSVTDLETFKRLAQVVHLRNLHDQYYPVEKRSLFVQDALSKIAAWMYVLSYNAWIVSFQVDALLRNNVLDAMEVLKLKEHVNACVSRYGAQHTADLLIEFTEKLYDSWNLGLPFEDVVKMFGQVKRPTNAENRNLLRQIDGNTFSCYHVTIHPSRISLEGPVPERSNRVIRSYPQNKHCFLRVAFTDENGLQYRFDRDIDGPGFIKERVGSILHNGITVGGKQFSFLAYSQSALKEHSVWFVTPFEQRIDNKLVHIDAPYIIKKLGYFNNLEFDPRLIYCPARYGARISQAFTATDASVTVEVEEILRIPDIKRNGSCFTDGVGTLSPELADQIWEALSTRRNRKLNRHKPRPRAFQVRFGGSKGVLGVDYSLSGRALCLRPSMIKFESPDSLEIEIAQSFDKPGRMCLNRPLITLLEGLGVAPEVFLSLQRKAVNELMQSTTSIDKTANLLEQYGLGASFHLTSVLKNLHKIGVQLSMPAYSKMIDISMNHILRELKHHARIPVPGWNLVGIADEHDYLEENQVFVCVRPTDGPRKYLHGPVMVSRSPTIHPGDIQMAYAIGPPPRNTPFEREALQNTVVFSTRGIRSLPSCLGGGDLDGDLYNVTDFSPLHPKQTYPPASYEAAPRKELDRPSTMTDVADFVVDYLNNDIVGIIAINWMIIADQSKNNIFDPDCLLLAQLHSDAVDYPKSGNPVPISKVPKLKFQEKPDWNAPEIITGSTTAYYRSERALGQLFRDIKLPTINLSNKRLRHNARDDLSDTMSTLSLQSDSQASIYPAIQERVSEFIYTRWDRKIDDAIREIFNEYCSKLQSICRNQSLSHSRNSQLSEEEALIGTIAAKCAQPRKRKDLMTKLREESGTLVEDIRDFILGADDDDSSVVSGSSTTSPLDKLRRAWHAWKIAQDYVEEGKFGAQSFWWIALGTIFDSIKAIESDERRSNLGL